MMAETISTFTYAFRNEASQTMSDENNWSALGLTSQEHISIHPNDSLIGHCLHCFVFALKLNGLRGLLHGREDTER
jgi:hypothetical protein